MALSPVATPYAMALLDLAVEQGSLPAVRAQLESLVDVLGRSRELQVAFSNPTISTRERQSVVQSLVGPFGLSKMARNFLMVLADKGRLSALPDIVTVLGRLADARTGAARAEVVASAPLDATQQERLKSTLAQMTGKTITLQTAVDPSLLGGLRVTVDGKVYDTSVATRLKRLREAILSDL